jgi:pimeloyl-ACP methyl ester carboxylesterase
MSTPIVLVHGLIGTLQIPDLLPFFDPNRVIAPDLLGYGLWREVSPSKVNIPAQITHLREILDRHCGQEPVHLVGHSIGGAIAALFAHAYPKRVASLVSVEGNFTLNDAFWSAAVAQMSPLEADRMLAGFRQDPQGWLTRAGIAPEPHFLAIGLHWLSQQPATTVQAMAQSVVDITGVPAYLPKLRTVFAEHPVHLLAGEYSRATWDVPDWAVLEAASFTVIPQTGHLMMLENPRGFVHTLKQLLDETQP